MRRIEKNIPATFGEKELGHCHTFKPKWEIAGIAEERHLEYREPVDEWYGILPMRQALVVPQLPKESTNQCRQSGQP